MNRNKKIKSLFTLIPILTFSLLSMTCSGSGGGIYATIEREVKLNTRTINNIVYRMTQFGSNLYACNCGLWEKGAGAGAGWTQVPANGVTGEIISVAADSTHLYVLAASSITDTSATCTVYSSTDARTFTTTGLTGTMTNIADGNPTGCSLFDNKAKDSSNRQAYFNSGVNAVILTGTGAGSSIGNYRGAAYWGGSSHYFKTEAITANKDETAGWTSDNLSVQDGNNHELWKDTINALTFFAKDPNTNNSNTYLFAGFDKNHNGGGYTPYNLSTNQPDTDVTTPDKGIFEGSDILFLRNINDTLYMSVYMQPSSKTGLWAYYPGSAGWNIE